MAGPCGGGQLGTDGVRELHKRAKCRDRETCQGPGCRVRRPPREARDQAQAEAG